MVEPANARGRFLALFTTLWTLGSALSMATLAEEKPAIAIARELVEAFNAHDAKAMASLVADEFELYYVDEKGHAALALTGPEALEAEMTAYFAALPEVRSEIAQAIEGPVYVSFREQIVGGQSSLAVYEIRDGRIVRVWYYPAEG